MVLSTVVISEQDVSPRGAAPGTNVTVPGSGFGPPTGRVRFDPLGENLDAVIVSWAPNQVVFTVPNVSERDVTYDVLIENAAGDDAATMPFWIPAATPELPKHQWPSAEAGSAEQDADNPRTMSAADINRVLDVVKGVADDVAGGVGETEEQDDFTGLLVDNQVDFVLSQAPLDPQRVVMDINGMQYRSLRGHFTVVGTALTWLPGVTGFSIEASDEVVAYYPVPA